MSEPAPLYPLLLDAALHVKVWGGRRLADVMAKSLPTDEPYGESWEMHDTSRVANGPLAGRALGDVLAEYGAAMIGDGGDPADGLPLLVKLLDASDWLSIQVHPDDAQAAELEGQPRGKTEAWVILDAAPKARLVIGVQPGTDREAMAAAIRENTLEDMVVYASVQPLDVLFIPANTVHAIGPGLLIYEIQQSSDTTYRLYDWGRMGLDGKPREMHVDKGVQVSNVDKLPQITSHSEDDSPVVTLVECDYFVTTLHRLNPDVPTVMSTSGRRFHAITCVDGAAEIDGAGEIVPISKGHTVLIPASVGVYMVSGNATLLRSWQPIGLSGTVG